MDEWETIEYRFAVLGEPDPLAVETRRFVSLVHGWLLDGKTQEQRDEINRLLDGSVGEIDRQMDAAIADAYRDQGEHELMIAMREELRHAKDPMKRAEIKIKYNAIAREKMAEQAKAAEEANGG